MFWCLYVVVKSTSKVNMHNDTFSIFFEFVHYRLKMTNTFIAYIVSIHETYFNIHIA